jgi:predicted acyltransferase
LWLAALHWICDHCRLQRWAFPFVVIGANSILIYVMSWTVAEPIRQLLFRHFGRQIFDIFGEPLLLLTSGAATIAVMFSVLLWLYRRRVFIKI